MTNRKNFPDEIKSMKLKHMDTKCYRSSDGILLCAWKDKKACKPVIAVSTYAVKGNSDVSNKRGKVTVKPTIIEDYNQSMNGCDNVLNRKTVKWWKRLFVWTMELAQVNSFILFCLTRDEGQKKTSLLQYKHSLVRQLVEKAKSIRPADQVSHFVAVPNVAVNCNRPAHLVKWVKDDRNCKVCSGPGARKRTNFICDTCNVYLHPKNCFVAFHTVK